MSSEVTYDILVSNSEKFNNDVWEFPTHGNRIKSIVSRGEATKEEIERHARSVRILVPTDVMALIQEFLALKLKHGTRIEKEVYTDMSEKAFVERLICKRPFYFFNRSDQCCLRNGFPAPGNDWQLVGEDSEGQIHLVDYLSYDEMQISALLGVSSESCFINTGSRDNRGLVMKAHPHATHQDTGVISGFVGARFEKSEYMESQHVLIKPRINSPISGYGANANRTLFRTRLLRMWARFYQVPPIKSAKSGPEYDDTDDETDHATNKGDVQGSEGSDAVSGRGVSGGGDSENARGKDKDVGTWFPSYEEIEEQDFCGTLDTARYHKICAPYSTSATYVDITVYKRRMRYSLETFLKDADMRAVEGKTTAYVHVVGLGLGVWMVNGIQCKWMLEEWGDIIRTGSYPNVSDIRFAWFDDKYCRERLVDDVAPGVASDADGHHIHIHYNRCSPCEKLYGEDEGKLLVQMFAWDSNAFPGNEYWCGMLAASGDPAAAAHSTIPELFNGYVNPCLSQDAVTII
eukprot:GFYU01004584.1.p1 GENE.GFYU01004584.1~~GFYU01004584.1.p1  ORF type:complete len:518 (-),score=118.07 GFYU01004584.1:387-1940(-)